MMLSLRERFDDYETMGEGFRDFKNELLEITLVEKQRQIMELLFKEIFAELVLTGKYSWTSMTIFCISNRFYLFIYFIQCH